MKSFSNIKGPLFAILGGMVLCVALSVPLTARAQDIDELLRQMTLEEKVGQMTQLTIQAVSETRGEPGTPHEIDMNALREAILDRHVGSLLNVYDMAMTSDQWMRVMTVIQQLALEESRLGVPIIYGIDAVHGNNYLMGATIFPQNIGLAATWNLDLAAEAARITALESRSVGHTWNFAPVLDVGRTPLWSRYFETYGEDPYTASEFGRAMIEAMQQSGPDGHPAVAATGKHFLGYSMPLSGKDRTPAWIPERMLKELFVPPFQRAIDADLKTIMVNSSEVNGIPVHADRRILTDLLRDEMGFEGVVVTDWEDIGKLVSLHRVADNYTEAVYMSVVAGIDMAMVPYDYSFTDALLGLVREGRISEDRIDSSVRRILQLKKDLGLFQMDRIPPTMRVEIGSEASHAASLEAARQSITLLKNEGVLPLAGGKKTMLAGPAANSAPMMFGGWSYTWQGNNPDAFPDSIPTLYDVLGGESGESPILIPWGESYEPDRARAHAYASDLAVIALGELPSVEKPGDIETLELSGDQIALVRDIAETGVDVVLVLFQNRPRIIRQIEPYADAIVLAYLPGPYGAQAVTDVLTGRVNPSGHLPFTYPRFEGSLVTYDHKHSETDDILFGSNAFQPQYPFGHGLSYTTFTYSNLKVDTSAFDSEGTVTATVTVTNTGESAGRDVAHLYVRDHVASVTPSVRRLRGFEPVRLAPGAQTSISWTLERDDFQFIGSNLEPVFESGRFSIYVDDLEAVIEL